MRYFYGYILLAFIVIVTPVASLNMKSWFKKKFNRLRGKFSKTTPSPMDLNTVPSPIDKYPVKIHEHRDCLVDLLHKRMAAKQSHQVLDRPFMFNENKHNSSEIQLCMLDGIKGGDPVVVTIEIDDSDASKGKVYAFTSLEPIKNGFFDLFFLNLLIYTNHTMLYNTDQTDVIKPRYQIDDATIAECHLWIADREKWNGLSDKKLESPRNSIDFTPHYHHPNKQLDIDASLCGQMMQCAEKIGYKVGSFYYGDDHDYPCGLHMCYLGQFRSDVVKFDVQKLENGRFHATFNEAKPYRAESPSLDLLATIFENHPGMLLDDQEFPRKTPKTLVT